MIGAGKAAANEAGSYMLTASCGRSGNISGCNVEAIVSCSEKPEDMEGGKLAEDMEGGKLTEDIEDGKPAAASFESPPPQSS